MQGQCTLSAQVVHIRYLKTISLEQIIVIVFKEVEKNFGNGIVGTSTVPHLSTLKTRLVFYQES